MLIAFRIRHANGGRTRGATGAPSPTHLTATHAKLQVSEHILDLRERGPQIIRDLLRKQVRLGEVGRVFEALVAKPEEIEADLVARRDLIVERFPQANPCPR